jgi:DNA polymerase III alpha subunit
VGKNITIGGIITKIQKIYLKNQKVMLFAMLEDTSGKIEILVFPKFLEQTLSVWEEEKVILTSGKISDKDGVFKLLADSVKIVTAEEVEKMKRIMRTQKTNGSLKFVTHPGPAEKSNNRIIITLPVNSSADDIKKLSQFFDKCDRGTYKVYLNINNSRLETPYRVQKSRDLKKSLQDIILGSKIDIS